MASPPVMPDRPAQVALPAQPTAFVGRADEVRLLEERLRQPEPRLLTLVGAAGTGKTRLAIEAAMRAADRFPDGVFFVDLAPITDASLVPSTIALVVGLQQGPERSVLGQLADYLAAHTVLLLLDNFEQLLPAAEQIAELLRLAPNAKLLVTSRSPLNVRWEQQFPVPPLPVPDLARLPANEELAEVPSVALFLQRAQRVQPDFHLNAGNARTVAEICVQLDGLPLAIELAAARSRVLPAPSLLTHLQRRLDFLESGALDQPRRQRTLRAALDWSYDLLTGEERVLFARLGVFVGGFALDALAEVCDPTGMLGGNLLAGVESLMDKSLLRQEWDANVSASEPRFGMLETIREYALERLEASGERGEMRRNHAAYYLGGAEEVLAAIRREQQATWLRSLEMEHDNIRAALAWCVEQREPELGLRAAGLLNWFWQVHGHLAEGRRWLALLLERAEFVPAEVRAEALRLAGSLALSQADYRAARSHFEGSLAISRTLADPARVVGPLSGLGATAMQEGDQVEAVRCFEEVLALQRALGDTLGVAESLNNLASLAHERGNIAAARSLFQQSLDLDREVSYRPDVPLHNLAIIALEEGELDTARRLFEESVVIKRGLSDHQGLAVSLTRLGEVAATEGNEAEALEHFGEALGLQVELGDRAGIAFILERCAAAAANRQPERVLRLAGAASALRESIGARLSAEAADDVRVTVEAARDHLPADTAASAWNQGRAMSIEQVVAFVQTVSRESLPPLVPAIQLDPQVGHPLTPREREVAVLVARGLSNRQIASELVVSERTADAHVSNILRKLDLTSRTQLAAWVVKSGLNT